MIPEAIWKIKSTDIDIVKQLSQQLNISPITAAVLYNRGLTTAEQARRFFSDGWKDLGNPFDLSGVPQSVQRIKQAVQNREKIVIYGDYDVDGICSIVILKNCLAAMNCEADYYVPDRFSEGYGINEQAVSNLAAQGYTLLISVDCGIGSIKEIETAGLLGLDSIITDHHTPSAELPPAVAVINPKLDPSREWTDLAGAGVAFALARALAKETVEDETVFDWLDLVALATIADIVPLQGENRILVKEGLIKLQNTSRPGLKALLQETGVAGKVLSAWQVSFILAPRLNSAGRLDSAALSIELLLESDDAKCAELAQKLCYLNEERKTIENDILIRAEEQIARNGLEREQVLILDGEGWHTGVLGIVASRLADKYTRPVILISWDGETGRGSGRSSGNFDLYQALYHTRQFLVQFGGHKMAAGITINRNQLEFFKSCVQAWTEQYAPVASQREITADLEISSREITPELCSELERMHPWGEGNPIPTMVIRGCEIFKPARLGKNGEHIKYQVGSQTLSCIAFNRAEWLELPLRECRQDILFEPGFNEYRGTKTVQLKIKDMKCSYVPDTGLVANGNMIKQAANELNQGRPVLFVYPTCRSMAKHKLAVANYFNPSIIKEMHGHLTANASKAVREALTAGTPNLFLVTDTCLRDFCRENKLPVNLTYIANIWPEAETVISPGWTEKYQVTVLPAIKQPCLVKPDQDWEWSGNRVLVYTNRKQTLTRINSRVPFSFIEAGLTNIEERRAVRQKFSNCPSGALCWDGSSLSLAPVGLINELVLADVPYGLYELYGAYGELAASAEIPAIAAFKAKDIEFNRTYLNRTYPPIDRIQQVWQYFCSHTGNKICMETSILLQELEMLLQKTIKWQDIAPIIHILTELDLCRMEKQGSIIEIKYIKSEISPADISKSLYYMEGLAEKKLYARFEAELIKNWSGD